MTRKVITKEKPFEELKVLKQHVAESKKVAKALKASEQNFRNSMDSSFMGIYIADADWHILYVNQAFLDIFGYDDIDEVRASPPHEHYTPEEYARHLMRDERLLRGEPNPDKFELDIVHKGGYVRHLQVSRQTMLWDGKQQYQLLYQDITERKQAEEALKISDESFRNTLDNSPMGIRISDRQDDTLYVNQAFLNMFGYENTEELRASPPLKHYTPESYADFLLRMEKQRGGKPRPDSVEIDIIRKDGTIRNLRLSTRELIWNGKQQFQNLYIDITDKKTAEEAVKESETRYHELVNTISSGVFIYKAVDNGADFVFVDINSAGEKMEGINRKDIIGKRVTEVLPNVKDYYWFSVFQRVWQTGNSEYFASGERQDERETGRWRDNWAYKLPNGEIMNIYDDITERKRAEAALKASDRDCHNTVV